MPRNSGTGVYSPPSNITAVSGAFIESADWNALVQDITTVMNGAWPVGLGGTGVSSLVGFLATLGGLPLAGGTLTGPLNLSGDATASLQPVTKQQFDVGLAGKADVSHSQAASTITDFAAAADARIGAASINALADVTATPTAGHILKANGTTWQSQAFLTELALGTLAANVTLSVAHGLAARPVYVRFVARNIAPDQGWAIGDEVNLSSLSSVPYRVTEFWNATVVGVVISTTPGFIINNKATRSDSALNLSAWQVFAYVAL
jgi:hypothetical protein